MLYGTKLFLRNIHESYKRSGITLYQLAINVSDISRVVNFVFSIILFIFITLTYIGLGKLAFICYAFDIQMYCRFSRVIDKSLKYSKISRLVNPTRVGSLYYGSA